MRRILIEDLGGKFYRLVDSAETQKAMLPKQDGMNKDELKLSSGVELPVTDFIYQQNDYRDRRYTLRSMTDEEERQTAQDYYHNIDLHRTAERNRVEQRRRVVTTNCNNMSKAGISNKLNSLRAKRAGYNQRLEGAIDSAERTNLLFATKNTEIDTSVLEDLVSSMAD
ncbi:MAG: hypothetical protein Athens101428_235 [Candidatus Berkelbacteria bacterium Athens1014_28]|uniref:Uncharacterized protein n=1 Tax=Candidatus Berkelbacteria bacterium Athens1014_28 TaxID=2017145 RepID=A0A554LNZ4_9BACT|nr:MAG: hypothetical protein Athens101428_235 [Candidatus Berkelbacteria bacterium Athens1014_28]